VDDLRQVTSTGSAAGEDTVALARTAAEAIRWLNHATRHQRGLGQPSAAYDLTGALTLAASGLPQLITQITRYLDQALAAGQLGHDHGEDPARNIRAAGIFLGDARASAAALAGDLDAAWQQLAPVNSHPAASNRKDRP
jgi:hypothetical protein